MTEEFAKELAALSDEIDAGRLPETAMPRLFYCGHDLLYGIQGDPRTFKCLPCQVEWEGVKDACPQCGVSDNVYETTDNRIARWRCKSCKHEWEARDGHNCPACGAHAE